jgi:hypothetical protein
VCCRGWIILDPDSFGKGTVKRKNIGYPNGQWFVGRKTKVDLAFMTFRSRMMPYLVNGYSNYEQMMAFGKPYCGISI